MPKIIEGLQQKILAAAKNRLFQDGYEGLALRAIAKDCGVAVGTIYNYYSSKDVLIASIMVEDWVAALKAMRAGCEAAPSLIEGFRSVFDAIVEFSAVYEPIWLQYSVGGGMPPGYGARHAQLRGQIAAEIERLLARFKKSAELGGFLAEATLSCAMQRDLGFSVLSAVVGRLFDL